MPINMPELPSQRMLEEIAQQFPRMDVTVLTTHLLLMSTFKEIYHQLEAWLGGYGISQGRFVLLMLLFQEQERSLTPSELADKARVTKGTITGLIDGLEKDHLIERRSHHKDRRMSTIHLTEKGEQLMKQLIPPFYEQRALIMSELSKEELKTLNTLLGKIAIGLERAKKA